MSEISENSVNLYSFRRVRFRLALATVTEEPTEKYGNTYITDGDGNTLYIYGIRQNGSLYEALATKPSVGDTVILRGYIVNYKGSADAVIEMKNAELIQIIR